jgi:hypothetical protein
MPVLSTGKTFSATEQITSTKLNNIANAADFTDTSGNAVDSASSTGTCVNGGGLEVTSGGQLQIADTGVSSAKLANNIDIAGTLDVTSTLTADSNVNISGNLDVDGTLEFDSLSGTGSVAVTDIKDEDTMSSNSATALATQQSIKAYVELFKPNIVQDTDTVSRTFDGSSSTDFLDTQLSVSITPKFSDSKFLITCSISSSTSNADYPAYFRVLRGSSVVTGSVNTDTVGSNHVKMMFGGGAGNTNQVTSTASFNFLDGVASGGTSAITYKVQIAARDGQEVHMNRSRNFTNSDDQASGISSLIVQEIYQ